jgi:hypothetical protein
MFDFDHAFQCRSASGFAPSGARMNFAGGRVASRSHRVHLRSYVTRRTGLRAGRAEAIRSGPVPPLEDAVAITLHRCSTEWLKIGPHPCWKVQKALDDMGIEYVLATGPVRRGKRDDLERLSGQRIYPVIEFEDGEIYRAESKEMEARIRSGQLLQAAPGGVSPDS